FSYILILRFYINQLDLHSFPTRRSSDLKAEELFPAIYDLFAIENRLGRWASQGNMIYSAAGIVNLNIFNCREIIESWMQIPRRKDRKSTRLNSSHVKISYAVFCLKKKNK